MSWPVVPVTPLVPPAGLTDSTPSFVSNLAHTCHCVLSSLGNEMMVSGCVAVATTCASPKVGSGAVLAGSRLTA